MRIANTLVVFIVLPSMSQGLRKNFGRICFRNHSEDRKADRDGGCVMWSYSAPVPRQTHILCVEQVWSVPYRINSGSREYFSWHSQDSNFVARFYFRRHFERTKKMPRKRLLAFALLLWFWTRLSCVSRSFAPDTKSMLPLQNWNIY